jgi:hypothetical protein
MEYFGIRMDLRQLAYNSKIKLKIIEKYFFSKVFKKKKHFLILLLDKFEKRQDLLYLRK